MSLDASRWSLTVLIALTTLCLPVLASAQYSPPPAGGAAGQQPLDVSKAAEQLQKAHDLQIAKKYAEAVTAYQEFLRLAKIAKTKIAPLAIQAAYSNMAQCYQLLDDAVNYKATLHTLLELDPKNYKALAQLAIITGAEHHFDEATIYANKAIALKPEAGVAAAAHFVLGNAAVAHKDFAGAAREFEIATQLMPKNAMAHYNYGLALAEEAALIRPKKAHDSLAQAQEKKFAAAQKELETAVKLDPKNTSARFYLARLKQQLHPSLQAGSPYDEILRQDPHNITALRGKALELSQNPLRTLDAISAYLDAILVDPNWFDGHYNVARLYISIGNFTASKQHFIKAHEIAAQLKNTLEDVRSLGELGYSEFLEGPTLVDLNQKDSCYRSAETHLKQALALIPNEINQKQASALTPNEVELKKQGVALKIQLAAVNENRGQFKEAVTIYRDLLTQNPDSSRIYTAFADSYKKQGKVDDYITTWKEYQRRMPDDPQSYQNIGDIYRSTRDWQKAIEEWKLLLTRHLTSSTRSSTYVVIAQSLVQLKEQAAYDEAEKDYKIVLDMKPSIVPKEVQLSENAALEAEKYNALRGLADLAATENKTEESIQWLTRLLPLDEAKAKANGQPMNGQAYHDIASLYEKDKKLDLALKEYMTWQTALPADPIPLEERGRLKDLQAQNLEDQARLLEMQGKSAEAVAAHKEADRLIAEAVLAYQSAARHRKDKDQDQDNLKVAEIYQHHKMYDKGIADLEELNKKTPKNKEIMTQLGLMYRETHQDLKALTLYDSLLTLDSSQRWVLDQKAIALRHLKRYDEAKAIYVQELDRSPFDGQVYADLALVYQETGQKEAFLTWLKPRFEKTPTNATLMAVVYDEFVSGMHEEEGQKYILSVIDKLSAPNKVKTPRRAALEAYANQLQIHKHNAESLEVYRTIATENPKEMNAWMSLADQLDFNGKQEEADKIHLDQIARTDISDLQRYSLRKQMGLRYMKQGKLEEAQAVYETLHTQTPTDSDTAMTLGGIIIRRGHTDEAIAYYHKLLDIAGYQNIIRVAIHNQLGALYEKENKMDEAQKEYQEALKLDPKNPVAIDALDSIAKKLQAH